MWIILNVTGTVCAKCEQINLYRDELQGLQRDLERAQLMAREAKTKPRNSMGIEVGCVCTAVEKAAYARG